MFFVSFAFPLLCLFFVNTLLVKITNRKFGDCFPIIIVVLPLITLLTHYLFRNLLYGIYLIYVVVLVSVIIFIMNIKDKEYRDKIFTTAFAIYLFIYTILYIITRGMYFFAWDEFAHWGPMINQMVENNKMYANVFHASYPPLVQLFEYILIKCGLIFEENNLKFVVQFFNMSILCLPMSERFADEEKKKFAFAKSIIFFLIVYLLAIGIDSYNSFRTIYLDVTVSMFFAYLLYLIIYEEEKYLLIIASFAFMLIKDISILYMSFVVFYLFIHSICEMILTQNKKEVLTKNGIKLLCILIPMIVSYVLWYIYKVNAGLLNDQFAINKFSVGSFLNIFSGKIDGEQLTAYNNYMKAIFEINLSRSPIPFTYFSSYIVLEVILIIYTFISKAENKILTFVRWTIFVTVTYIIYMLFMLNMYVNIFVGSERTDLASYARYVSSFVLGIYVITFVNIYKYLHCKLSLYIVYLVVAAALGSTFLSYTLNPTVNHSLLFDPLQNERKAYKKLNEAINFGDSCLMIIDYTYYTDVVKNYYLDQNKNIELYDIKNFADENNVRVFLEYIHNYDYLYITDTLNQTIDPFVGIINEYTTIHPEYSFNLNLVQPNEVIRIR